MSNVKSNLLSKKYKDGMYHREEVK